MHRIAFLACFPAILIAVTSASAAENRSIKRTYRIDLSTRHTMKTQDWSGSASISRGEITAVEKTSGASDTIHPDKSWTIVYGRSLANNPKQQPIAKSLLISVAAPDDAMLTAEDQGRRVFLPGGRSCRRQEVGATGGRSGNLAGRAEHRPGRQGGQESGEPKPARWAPPQSPASCLPSG